MAPQSTIGKEVQVQREWVIGALFSGLHKGGKQGYNGLHEEEIGGWVNYLARAKKTLREEKS